MTNPVMPQPGIEALLDQMNGAAFPTNIIEIAAMRFELLDLDFNVVKRMPSTDDPNYTLGIVPVVKAPQPDTAEIAGRHTFQGATISEYLLCFYAFVKDADRERGLAAHSVMAEIVEDILASDQALRESLGVLEATVMGQKKRMQRYYIRNTRYLARDIDGSNMFMSATEVVFEVEKVR